MELNTFQNVFLQLTVSFLLSIAQEDLPVSLWMHEWCMRRSTSFAAMEAAYELLPHVEPHALRLLNELQTGFAETSLEW